MRRIVFISLAVITLVALSAAAWVFAGEQLSLFLDRFQTVRLASLPMQPLSAYNGEEGTYHVGKFVIGKEEMTTGKLPDFNPFPLTVHGGDGNQLFLSTGGRSFRLGPLLATTHDDAGNVVFTFAPEPEDKASFTLEKSLISWPMPFEVNFMTGGSSASWRRHLIYRLLWQKRSGAKLEMVWRYRQDFTPSHGWENVWTREGSAGLIRVEISP